MKQIRKNSKPVLSCIVMAIICIMGTITAFAYQAPIKVETEDPWSEYDTVVFENHGSEDMEHLLYDDFFVDKNGNIISLENAHPRLFCKHNFIEGYVNKHKKNSDGSCVTRKYECSCCNICGYSIEGTLISKTEYTVCPH